MARRVLDAKLDSRTARGRLKASGKPYWRPTEPGVSLGYRKPLSGAGKWVLRLHVGGKNDYTTETFATADDVSDADGVAVLSFWQAQDTACPSFIIEAVRDHAPNFGLAREGKVKKLRPPSNCRKRAA
jgi:hypothetical protein